jgi:DNA-binding GntR family transcriptional regulator
MAFKHEHPASPRQVYWRLRSKILSVEILPHAPLIEQRLAEELGFSRTPVREALAKLAAEGLVEVYPNRGAIVAPIRTEAVQTAQFVREALEVAVALEAAKHIDRLAELELRQAIEEQKAAEAESNVDLFYRADERMHRALADIAGKPLAWSFIEDAKIHMDRARKLNLLDSTSFTTLIEQHEAIVAAILQGSRSKIEKSVKTHLRKILPDLDLLKRQHPEYFAK